MITTQQLDYSQGGSKLLTDTAEHTPPARCFYYLVQVFDNSVFAKLEGNLTVNETPATPTAFAVPAGTVLYGNFTKVQLTSGRVVVHQTPLT